MFNNQTKVHLNYKINTKINKTNKIELKKHYDEELVCKKALIVNAHSNRKIVKTIDTLNNFREVNYKQVYVDNYKNYFVSYNNILKLKKDFTLIDENIFIPKNFLVKINSGQSITLINNAFIFSDSAWVVDGSKQKIYISGEKKNFGGGLIISDSNKKSIFKNVTFSYLSGLKSNSYDKKNEIFITTKTAYQSNNRNSYKEEAFVLDKKSVNLNSQYILFGSINFFNTKVILKEIIFEKISSEDALNIVSSDFEIDKIKFLENLHDGLDIDFGNGSINRSKFINIGNDAIDLSGSKVTINDTDINLVGDKMISVGENSNIEILNLDGSNSFVGIAVKDGSTIKADRIRLNNTKIGFAAYQKKEEYLYPKIIANNINIQNANVKWLTDNNSKIVLNNKLINSKTDKILPIIYEQNIELLN